MLGSLACRWQTHLPDAPAELRNTHSLDVIGRLTCPADSLARQTHLPDATSLHPGAVPQRGTGGSYVEKPAEILRLASAS
jgi:hypothetical protein